VDPDDALCGILVECFGFIVFRDDVVPGFCHGSVGTPVRVVQETTTNSMRKVVEDVTSLTSVSRAPWLRDRKIV
jgi:hypothetical protein